MECGVKGAAYWLHPYLIFSRNGAQYPIGEKKEKWTSTSF